MKERIRILRKSLKMTQKEFANSIGLKSSSAIGNIELGLIELSQRNIDLICKKHNVMMCGCHQKIFNEIIINGGHSLHTLAAPVLTAEIINSHPLNIT